MGKTHRHKRTRNRARTSKKQRKIRNKRYLGGGGWVQQPDIEPGEEAAWRWTLSQHENFMRRVNDLCSSDVAASE